MTHNVFGGTLNLAQLNLTNLVKLIWPEVTKSYTHEFSILVNLPLTVFSVSKFINIVAYNNARIQMYVCVFMLQATEELRQLVTDPRIVPVLCEILASSSNAQVCTVRSMRYKSPLLKKMFEDVYVRFVLVHTAH